MGFNWAEWYFSVSSYSNTQLTNNSVDSISCGRWESNRIHQLYQVALANCFGNVGTHPFARRRAPIHPQWKRRRSVMPVLRRTPSLHHLHQTLPTSPSPDFWARIQYSDQNQSETRSSTNFPIENSQITQLQTEIWAEDWTVGFMMIVRSRWNWGRESSQEEAKKKRDQMASLGVFSSSGWNSTDHGD